MEDLRTDLDVLAYFNLDFDDFKYGLEQRGERDFGVLPIDEVFDELCTFRNVEYLDGYLE